MKSLVPDEARADFRNFLYMTWGHLNLPDPTPAQYEFAYYLQYGREGYLLVDGECIHIYDDPAAYADWKRRKELKEFAGRGDILEGFRGVGKSFVTSSYALWCIDGDPVDEKILVVSASGGKSKEFVTQTKGILLTMPELAHLRLTKRDRDLGLRDQADRFDVHGASQAQSATVKAVGITGQITGSRSTRIIADDIEVPDNSATEEARTKLLGKANEFDAIIMPGADIIFLGTPQTEESIYNKLIKERGYNCLCWPARYPKSPASRKTYVMTRDDGEVVDILAPPLAAAYDKAPTELAWTPTDPDRFDNEELLKREGRGRSYFMLQFMLDTTLSDAERYPLKQFDLIVMNVNTFKAPMAVQWGRDSDAKNVLHHLKNHGFTGDRFMGPLFIDPEWRPFDGSVLFVDPAGRGADECAWAILKALNGMLYCPLVAGTANAPHDELMMSIATDARNHNVNLIQVEPNYGGDMWVNAIAPILTKIWPGGACRVEEAEWSSGMKEARIIDTLEPVMNTHRLVVDESVASDPILMHQLTRITKQRNCLRHDDRIDALAGAVAYFVKAMKMDVNEERDARLEEEKQAILDQFIEDCTGDRPSGFIRGRRPGTEVYMS